MTRHTMTIPLEETTNAVLKEKIEGLTKLTDERFGTIKESLVRIEGNQSTFALKTEVDEVKKDFTKTIEEIRKSFNQHYEDDKKSDETLSKQIFDLQRFIWMTAGVLAVLTFIAPALFHHFGWV